MGLLRKQGMRAKQPRTSEAKDTSQKNLGDYATTCAVSLSFILENIIADNKGRKNFPGLMLHLHW